MLFMIGVGLGDENDVTVKGDAAIRASSLVVLEMYTSILAVNTERLAEKYGKEIVIADREMVESEAERILEPAKEGNVAFLVVGDVLAATTHTDLALRAMDMGIEVRVIHNASIMNAVASCGLQLYNFGQTITVPFWTSEWQPDSFFDKIMHNVKGGLHTLCLLDIKVKEPDFKAMAMGKRKFLPPRFMTIKQAAAILLEIGRRKREEGKATAVETLSGATIDVFSPESRAVAVCRVGMENQLIASGTLEQLARSNCGPPLHSLVLVGETHELEDAILERFDVAGKPGRGPRPAPSDAVGALPEPARAILEETPSADLEVWEIPPAGDPRPAHASAFYRVMLSFYSYMLTMSVAILLVSASKVSFVVDAQGDQVDFRKLWLNCVGSSHASMSLRQDWRSQLTRAAEEIGFKRVRFHGILDDDMSAYLPDAGGPKGTNMWNIFSTLDFLQDIDMEPLVELSFMPLDLMAASAGQEQTVMHYRGIRSPPKSWPEWNGFIQSIMAQVYERYGKAFTVEVWNEPNCGFYVGDGCNSTSGNFSAYQELYENTAKSVLAGNSAFQVAGPVTAQLEWLEPFLAWAVDAGNAPVRQVTSHLYPTDPVVNQSDRFGWVKAISEAAGVVGKRGLNLTLSEFNAGLSPNISVRDGPYTAAFLGHLAFASQALPSNVDGLSFWTFSDVFEEQGMLSAPFHGGFGLMTSHSINKPGYCAMQLLSRHGDAAVPVKASPGSSSSVPLGGSRAAVGATAGSVDAVATVRSDGGLVLTMANFEPEALAAPGEATVTLTLTNLPPAQGRSVKLGRVDASNCNPLATWQQQGSPLYPSRSQISALAAVGVPGVSTAPCVAGSAPTECTVNITIPPFGFVAVELLV